MTKKNNPIDQLFKENIEKDYLFDENLWNKVDNTLSKRGLNFIGMKGFSPGKMILIMLLFTLLFMESGIEVTAGQNLKDSPLSNKEALDVNENEEVEDHTTTASNSIDQQKIKKEKEYTIAHKSKTYPATISNQKNLKEANSIIGEQSKNLNLNQKSVAKAQSFQKSKREDETKSVEKTLVKSKRKSILQVENTAASAFIDDATSTQQTENKIVESGLILEAMPKIENSNLLAAQLANKPIANSKREIEDIFNTKKKSRYLEFEVRRSIQLNKSFEMEDKAYEKYKKENEKPLYQYNIGINLMKDQKKFTYGLGLHFEKIRELVRLKQQSFKYSYDTTYKMLNDSYYHNGQLIFIIERQIDTDTSISFQKTINTYTEFNRLQLPLFLGYKFNLKNWDMEMRSGIYFSYLIQSKGNYLGSDFTSQLPMNSEYINNFNISHQLQLRLSYALNENIAVGTALDYRYEITSSMKYYNNKFKSYGALIFIRSRIFD